MNMKRSIRETTLKLKDLPCAAFLISSGLQVSDVERDGRVCYFVFAERERALDLCKGFWSGTATVNAKQYSDAMRSLKDLVFSIPAL